ncbi:MAG: nicotinate-nucleotide adenylyltransferase [Muribaculaceae bacterium]|nr:nicotinate-nucleotide adenylyltransferase [Muribaculaceae bacterium]
MRIGIYSGSFDPIHSGHAMLANFVAQSGEVDEVWLMVSPLNPLKQGTHPAADAHRLQMVDLVAKECEGVRTSDFELSLPVPSYTYTTLCRLREAFPQHSFRIIIGSDNWKVIDRWRNADKIIDEFGIIIYPRPGYEITFPLPDKVTYLQDAPTVELSSTFIRNLLKTGKNINYFVPIAVSDYIRQNNLYS